MVLCMLTDQDYCVLNYTMVLCMLTDQYYCVLNYTKVSCMLSVLFQGKRCLKAPQLTELIQVCVCKIEKTLNTVCIPSSLGDICD